MRKILAATALVFSVVAVNVMAADSFSALKIKNYDEYHSFAQNYYLKPEQNKISDALRFISLSKALKQPELQQSVLISFSCIFDRYDNNRKRPWINTIKSLDSYSRQRLLSSVRKKPEFILKRIPLSPKKNDMNWSCFFASGKKSYVYAVTYSLKYLDNRTDYNLYLTALTAKWSLTKYARRYERVREVLRSMLASDELSQRQLGQEMLSGDPETILNEGLNVISENKELGIW